MGEDPFGVIQSGTGVPHSKEPTAQKRFARFLPSSLRSLRLCEAISSSFPRGELAAGGGIMIFSCCRAGKWENPFVPTGLFRALRYYTRGRGISSVG